MLAILPPAVGCNAAAFAHYAMFQGLQKIKIAMCFKSLCFFFNASMCVSDMHTKPSGLFRSEAVCE